jgi:hypothetical protein
MTKNDQKSVKIGQHRSKSVKISQNQSKSVKIGQNRSKSVKKEPKSVKMCQKNGQKMSKISQKVSKIGQNRPKLAKFIYKNPGKRTLGRRKATSDSLMISTPSLPVASTIATAMDSASCQCQLPQPWSQCQFPHLEW